MNNQEIKAEREFWTLDENFVRWEDVEDIGPWYKFNDYWYRRVNYTPNSYGDSGYVEIYMTFDNSGEVNGVSTYRPRKMARSW